MATGSEVELALKAASELEKDGHQIRVVSMPSTNTFDQQSSQYKETVLPSAITSRIAIEAGFPDFWYKYVGLNGKVLGMPTFGESAPASDLFEEFGFTTDKLVAMASEFLSDNEA